MPVCLDCDRTPIGRFGTTDSHEHRAFTPNRSAQRCWWSRWGLGTPLLEEGRRRRRRLRTYTRWSRAEYRALHCSSGTVATDHRAPGRNTRTSSNTADLGPCRWCRRARFRRPTRGTPRPATRASPRVSEVSAAAAFAALTLHGDGSIDRLQVLTINTPQTHMHRLHPRLVRGRAVGAALPPLRREAPAGGRLAGAHAGAHLENTRR